MGSAKEQMYDESGMLVRFACPDLLCDGHVEGEVEDTSFDFSSDSQRDGQGYSETPLSCDECDAEYIVAVRATGVGKQVFLVDHPDTDVEFIDNTFSQDYDDFLFGYTPDDPYGVYNRTTLELDKLFHGSDIKDGPHDTFQRIFYLQHFIAFEAYLSDRLIRTVTDDPEKLVALVGATPALRDAALKLIDVAKDPNYVLNTTKEFLQRFSFHDVPRVALFYKAVLKIDLFEDDAQQQQFATIIKHRHDLVHRSGRDNDGNEIEITFGNVFDVRNLLSGVVARIEAAYTAYTAKRYFEPSGRAKDMAKLA